MRKPLKIEGRFRVNRVLKKIDANQERLTSAAIIRAGVPHFGQKSHAQIRASLGDEHCTMSQPDDQEGFWTGKNRFVTREEAMHIGAAAGQCQVMRRTLLSSDIDW